MAEEEYNRIIAWCKEHAVSIEIFEHAPVRTSAEAAAVRGAEVKQGVKALVVKFNRKGHEFFLVFAIPADKRLDWKKAKAVLQASDCRMATEQEVIEKTGCEPGGVPPFGHAHKLPIIADKKIFDQEMVEFNAGMKTRSLRLKSQDLKKVFDALGVAYFDVITP